MTKRRRKDKELAHLRREVEVLRAQLAGGPKISPATEVSKEPKPATTETQKRTETRRVLKTQPTVQTVDPKFIKADLLKSGILTLIALGIIATLNFIL